MMKLTVGDYIAFNDVRVRWYRKQRIYYDTTFAVMCGAEPKPEFRVYGIEKDTGNQILAHATALNEKPDISNSENWDLSEKGCTRVTTIRSKKEDSRDEVSTSPNSGLMNMELLEKRHGKKVAEQISRKLKR